MEPMHWHFMGALGGVIGIGWLVVVPMYRGWKPLNQRMSKQLRETTTLLAMLEENDPLERSPRQPSTRYLPSIR